MLYVLSCPGGCSGLLKNELKALGYPLTKVLSPSTLQCEADESALARLNLWSRIANKVYVVVGEGTAPTFERLFDLTHRIDRAKYIQGDQAFTVNARSNNSMLTSLPSLQAMGKKAISKKLTGNDERREEETLNEPLEVLLSLENNHLQILLNTSGSSLHRRGYRTQTGEAPIKENLAAALVFHAGWRFRDPLYDITCGSGTIVIEAAMIAKNIAPGALRTFAFETWSWYDTEHIKSEREKAQAGIMVDKQHTIIGNDIDETMIKIAKANAEKAGVGEFIQFSVKDMTAHVGELRAESCFISNPPYGERLLPENIEDIYKTFDTLFMQEMVYGGIITSYETRVTDETKRDMKTFFNGPDKVAFRKKNR